MDAEFADISRCIIIRIRCRWSASCSCASNITPTRGVQNRDTCHPRSCLQTAPTVRPPPRSCAHVSFLMRRMPIPAISRWWTCAPSCPLHYTFSVLEMTRWIILFLKSMYYTCVKLEATQRRRCQIRRCRQFSSIARTVDTISITPTDSNDTIFAVRLTKEWYCNSHGFSSITHLLQIICREKVTYHFISAYPIQIQIQIALTYNSFVNTVATSSFKLIL